MDLKHLTSIYTKHCTQNYFSKTNFEKSGLPYLRDKLFISIMLISFPVAILIFLPSFIFTLVDGDYLIATTDGICLGLLVFIFFNKTLKLKTKKILFTINIYILATVLLFGLGARSPGIIVLYTISVFATLYNGRLVGLVTVLINAFIYIIAFVGIYLNIDGFSLISEYLPRTWVLVSLNHLSFNFVSVLAVSFLVDHLQKSFLRGLNLQLQLKNERKDLIEAKIKSEESERLKSAFLANISYEIRTPMNGILGFTGLLNSPDLTSQDKDMYIGIIQKSGERMLNTINDIIDISRIDSGVLEVKLQSVDIIREIVLQCNFYRKLCIEKDIAF